MSFLLGTDEETIDATVGRTAGFSLLDKDAQTGFTEGAATAAGMGVYRGISRGASVAANVATPVLRPVAQKIDEIFGTSADQYLLEEQAKANRSLIESKIDGQTTGLAGQLLYGIGDVLTTVASTGGNPWAAGGLYGTTQAGIGIMDEGLDTTTAIMKGAVEGVGMGVGVALPAALAGSLAYRLGTGAAMNVAQGVATRAGVATVLNTRGYEDMAKQYEAFGVTDMLIDGVLGATFGGFMGKVKPSDVDAALVRQSQAHTELGTAPGIPVDTVSRNAHVKAVDMAREQMLRGEDVEVSRVADRATFAREDMPPEMAAAVREVESVPELARAVRELEETQEMARARGLVVDDAPLYSRDDVTQTPEFKAWSEDAPLVKNGKASSHPFKTGEKVVVEAFHGAPDVRGILSEGFKGRFGDDGVFFAADAYATANSYADARRAFDFQNAEDQTLPLFVSFRNPMVIDAEGRHWRDTARHIQEAKSGGHDGIIIKNSIDDYNNGKSSKPTTVYAFFDGAQAKSNITDQLRSRVDRQLIDGAVANFGTFSRDDNRIQFSRGDSSAKSTVPELTTRFRSEFGKDADRLTNYARVEFVQSVSDLPGGPHPSDVRGMFWQGRSYVVADNVPPDAIKGLILHEVGAHAGFHTMLGAEGYASVMNHIDARIADGDAVFMKAREIAEQRANRPEHIREETLAYLVEAAPELPFIRRILAQVRQWLYRQTGGRFVNLNADDMAAMVSASLRVYAKQAEAEAKGGMPMYQRAFHGSPHRFDKFSTDAMGSGEGAQAYGWGLYFAGNREVAEWYRDNLSSRQGADPTNEKFDGKTVMEWYQHWSDKADRASDPTEFYDRMSMLEETELNWNPQAALNTAIEDELSPKAIDWFKKTIADKMQRPGTTYEVNIPEDDTMLLWDKPLSEHSPEVQNALAPMLQAEADRRNAERERMNAASPDRLTHPVIGKLANKVITVEDIKGQAAYEAISKQIGGDEAASKYLNSLGISGIKYLDGTSRADGDGSYNYVIFDDKNVAIESTQYSRESDLQQIREAANQPLGTAIDDNPDMRIPDEEGVVRSAVDIAADAADDIQRMTELSKGFEAAITCAFRFGT